MALRESRDLTALLRQSLVSDKLASQLYSCHCEFSHKHEFAWDDLSSDVRHDFRELASHFLMGLSDDMRDVRKALTRLSKDLSRERGEWRLLTFPKGGEQ